MTGVSQPSPDLGEDKNQGGRAPRRWTRQDVLALQASSIEDLVHQAQQVLRGAPRAARLQRAHLFNIKTGGCPEDCGYCAQSAHFATGVQATRLVGVEEVRNAARKAKALGADRFCMGAAWRELKERDLPRIAEMIRTVKAEGLETCVTLGMVTLEQARALGESGLDYYNHNLDTGPDYYASVVTTRLYEDRLQTLAAVRKAGVKLCCGGIFGMGERASDRADLLVELAKLDPPPESIPLNQLVPIAGTPLATASTPLDPLDFIRWIAVTRIMFPAAYVRIAAGREAMTDEAQCLAFLAGADSIFVGPRLLTTSNAAPSRDEAMLSKLGLRPAIGEDNSAAPRHQGAEL